MLGVGKHVAEVLKESADADARQCEQQERGAYGSGSKCEEKERARAEKLAVQRGVAALAEQAVRSHAQGIQQINPKQKRTAEHRAAKAQTAEDHPQLFLVVGGRQQHSGKQHQLNAHGVIVERHDVVGRVEVIERTGDHGENAVFAQPAVEQHGRGAVYDDIENARRQNDAVGGTGKEGIDSRERQQQEGRHQREVPFVLEQRVAHQQAVGDRLIKRLVVAAKAVAHLPDRKEHAAEQQRREQNVLPFLFVVTCALCLHKFFYFLIENNQSLCSCRHHKGRRQRAHKAQRHGDNIERQLLIDVLIRHVDPAVIDQQVKDERQQIHAEGDVRDLPHDRPHSRMPVVGAHAAEQHKQERGDDKRLHTVPEDPGAGLEGAAVAAVEAERRAEKEHDAEQRQHGARFELDAVFADIGAGKVVGDGVHRAHPERRNELLIALCFADRLEPPLGGVKAERIDQRGQNGEHHQRCHQHLLFALGFELVVREIQERRNQKQPDIHFDIPRVVGAGKVKDTQYKVL